MKKMFTLSLAVAAVASAYAIAPKQAAPVAIDSHKQMMLQSTEMVQPAAEMSTTLAPTAVAKNATVKAVPEDATGLTHYYATPAGGFYAQNSFTLDGGTYMYPIMVVPAYANNVWVNSSYYFDAEGNFTSANSSFSYAWNYWDFDFYEASSTAESLEVMNQPYIVKGLMMDAPALTADADTVYQYGGGVIYGGKGHLPQYFIEGNGLTDVTEAGLRPFDPFSDDIEVLSRTGSFGLGANESGSGWDYYASQVENFKVDGMAQVFQKPAAPYALSSVTVYAAVNCEAGAEITATFYKIDDEGNLTAEVVAEDVYKFPEAFNSNTAGSYYPITFEFTTEDEFGFELDYTLVDCSTVMVISGYEENSLVSEFDLNVLFHKQESPSFYVEPNNFLALCSYGAEGAKYTGLASFPYLFYTDDTRTALMYPTSMNILVELEYPYLQTTQNLETNDLFPIQETHNLSLAAGEDIYMAVFCSGSAADIMVSDCPEWLEMLVEDRTQDVNGMTGEYVEVAFAVSAEATNVGEACDVTLSYKGCEQTYHITHAAAGVDNVAKDNVEVVAVEYYNIQGQKLNVAPENGIFIQRNIKADGTVNNVKVVK